MSGIVGSRLNIRGSGLVGSVGTDGQVLTSSGAGVGHTFEDAAGGGAWNFLGTDSVSDGALLETTGLFSSTYKLYMVVISNLRSEKASPVQNIYAQVRSGGSYLTGDLYDWGVSGWDAGTTNHIGRAGQTDSAAQITMDGTGAETNVKTQSMIFWLDNPASTTYNTNVRHETWGLQNETKGLGGQGGFTYFHSSSPAAIDGLKIYGASDNITGTIYTYGLALS